MRYTIVSSTNPDYLIESVRSLMSEGWEPVGGLAIESRNVHPGRVKGNYDIGEGYYYQSMIHHRDRKERAEAAEAAESRVNSLTDQIKDLEDGIATEMAMHEETKSRVRELEVALLRATNGLQVWKKRAEAIARCKLRKLAQEGEGFETWWVNVFRLEDGKLHCDKKPFKSEKIARVNFTIELNEEYIGAFPIRLPCVKED